MNDVFGMSALIISLVLTFIGLPAQAFKNYKLKSTKGLSLIFYLIIFLNMNAWLFYGLTMPKGIDWYLVTPNITGFIFVIVLFMQFWIYRKPVKAG